MTPGDTSIQSVVLWAVALTTLFNFISLIWGIFSGPSRKLADRLDASERRLADRLDVSEKQVAAQVAALNHAAAVNEAALVRLRDRVDSLPNADMMHRLELSLARMEGHIDKLDERLKPVAAIAERMQDLLIEQGHK